ncbi:Rhomboid family protein [Pelagimonas phthalicica]|uniref:Rhomboid family protein n=1 Tax=Pelagimonas phthalicica TaxID=1037362 RepID=A0A238JHN2_9RHOB|nr:rhomboid family intramembrane serine protease [Pelagimonas phthalicica]TDS89787.1 membrane associated rhomboid family serine protease [Pelagimonas phthalicica]SMX29955.1 Rhomboid family protein [Pelagimonas phthalicica]
MSHPQNESPVNPMPPVVVALFLVMAGIELAFNLAQRGLVGGRDAVGWRIEAWERFGFSSRVLDWMVETSQWPAEHLIRFVSYMFIHASFTHGLFAIVFLLALGKIVAEALGPWRFLVIYFGSAALGALGFAVILDDPQLLIGAMVPAYGLIGGFTFFSWVDLDAQNEPRIRAFRLIGALLAIQLFFGLLFGSDQTWVAELCGFVAGFGLTVFLVPGSMARILRAIRRD